MKAKDFLKWLVDNSINTESMQTVTIDNEFDYEGYFGNPPLWLAEPGEYVAVWTDSVLSVDLEKLKGHFVGGPYTVVPTDSKDNRNGGLTAILLIKLED